MRLLDGKIVLVTGASRGIGLATSTTCAQHGATVLMLGRNEETLEQARQQVTAAAETNVFKVVADVTDPVSVANAFQAIFKQHKRLDALVANAGVLEAALIGMVTESQIEHVFSVNTFGVLYCSQYAARLMVKSGGGSIVSISSIVGTHGTSGLAVYGGSKAAVIGITKSLAKELAPQQIRVNAIAPGFIDTDMTRSLPVEKFAERAASIGMGRVGTPGDVADAALFLISDLSRYVTGQIIGVDGGMLI